MEAGNYRDLSITIVKFLLHVTGIGVTTNSEEERRRRYILLHNYIVIAFAIYLSVTDICHSFHNLGHCLFATINLLCIILVFVKISILVAKRTKFLDIHSYADRNFWHLNYDKDEKKLLMGCQWFCTAWMITICFFSQSSLCGYVLTPLYMNHGRNKSDRVLPFEMWVNLPLYESPYFEIMFSIQVMCVYQIGAAYLANDTFMCLMNMHIICQFRILQHRLCNLWAEAKKQSGTMNYEDKCYKALKGCIRQHESLIQFCKQMENIYTFVILSHMVIFSLLMCLDTFEVLVADIPTAQRITFGFHMVGSFVHIVFFTYTCDGLIEESLNINIATYSGDWSIVPINKVGRMLRRDIQIMIMRSARPCGLTAGGFFPISLATSTTAMCVCQVGASYIASDVFLCVLIMHAVCHFRILQQKLQNLWKAAEEETGFLDYGDNCYAAIKKCIQQHQSLIAFCDKLEDVYSFVILGHMVIFSLLMCLDTFQMLLGNVPTVTRIIFIFHMVGSFIHVVLFNYTCHSLMEESRNVSLALYFGWWTILPMNNAGKMLRKDIQIMIMRSLRPCCLTAGGYFPVSVETSTALISSTVSYFTLMRESSMKSEDG